MKRRFANNKPRPYRRRSRDEGAPQRSARGHFEAVAEAIAASRGTVDAVALDRCADAALLWLDDRCAEVSIRLMMKRAASW